jgi:hypothetical protein
VKNLFDRPSDSEIYRVHIPENPKPFVEEYVEELESYLDEKLGKDHSIWFHVDEHSKMCDRRPRSEGGAAFLRGAMETLALIRNAKVVATCTARPAVPVITSSGVCRIPIALPLLDVNQLIIQLLTGKSNFVRAILSRFDAMT